MGRKQQPLDPAVVVNHQILADREERILAQAREIPDLGLDLKEEPAGSADDFFRDEFDRKAFGEVRAMYSKTVYGPDPLIDSFPQRLALIERMGLHDYAEMMRREIHNKGAAAMPDPSLRAALAGAINKFGTEQVADAFADRIMRIPSRVVHYEADDEVDVEVSGSRVMADIINRYSRPGMSYKFLSERIMQTLTQRGYEIVKDERGDPVRCGTLILGEIRESVVQRRREHQKREAAAAVGKQVEEFEDEAMRIAHNAGAVGRGSGPLRDGDMFQTNATNNEAFLGESRPIGFHQETL